MQVAHSLGVRGKQAVERWRDRARGEEPVQGGAGAGTVQRERTLSVAIPAGMEDGTRIRLSGDVEVPAIGGSRAKVEIPAGTQTGNQFRLRGKGFSMLRSAVQGDMYIQVAVETPRHLSRRQRKLLEEFETEAADHAKGSPEAEGFFAKVAKVLRGG